MQQYGIRNEFPNPAFEREQWKCLNGTWQFAYDPENLYESQPPKQRKYPMQIQVPFCPRAVLSGIGNDMDCPYLWYQRAFHLTHEEASRVVLLRFGAVDYIAKVWVNGSYVGRHEGGFIPFVFEITNYIHPGENTITVKAEDSYSKEYPRGKQMWGEEPKQCWYVNTSGIWQSVWLEFTGENYITNVRITPDIDHNTAQVEVRAKWESDVTLEARFLKDGEHLGTSTVHVVNGRGAFTFFFGEHGVRSEFELYWTPDFPVLIDVELRLIWNGREQDRVKTYFGMRKIHREGDKIFLNNRLLYQRLVLDQGYWPDGLMTAPSDEAFRRDIELTKKMGFNGARKHQKIEDPRYYYWADKMGLLIWGELPSAYDFTPASRDRLVWEMKAFVERDYNHPCIINWVPFNESWGVHQVADNAQQQDFVRALYYLIKAEDPTRLVASNDGWEQLETTDICGVHDYDITPENAAERYQNLEEVLASSVNFKPVYARGIRYNGLPVLLTEMGGVKLKDTEGWGYQGEIRNEESMLDYLRKIMAAIRSYDDIQGFCYTQLTDVMQETNGLLSPKREPRVPLEVLQTIFG